MNKQMNKNTECRKVFIHAVDISKMHVLNPNFLFLHVYICVTYSKLTI